jgi:hypothetical protein
MASLPMTVSLHRSAPRTRRYSNTSWTDVAEGSDMDPEGFSLSDLAFEMEEEYASSDTVFNDDVCAPLDHFPPHRPTSSLLPPPLPKPFASEKLAPRASEKLAPRVFVSAFYAPSTSSESPVDVTDDSWMSNGAGSTPGMHCLRC